MDFDIHKTWYLKLSSELKKSYILDLLKFIGDSKNTVYPDVNDIFLCLKLTPLDKVKVVFLGQDPYCSEGQAHGLSFSILPGIKLPISLYNIFLELYNDLGVPISSNGCLINWAKQGVLLLNSSLTVEKNKPGSHLNIGWERFTDEVIKIVSSVNRKVIFVLLGKQALLKSDIIDLKKNYIIYASHPSVKSAHISFFGSRIFSKINMHLKVMGYDEIDWRID